MSQHMFDRLDRLGAEGAPPPVPAALLTQLARRRRRRVGGAVGLCSAAILLALAIVVRIPDGAAPSSERRLADSTLRSGKPPAAPSPDYTLASLARRSPDDLPPASFASSADTPPIHVGIHLDRRALERLVELGR